MAFKKTITLSMIGAFLAFAVSNVVFAAGTPNSGDVILDGVLQVLNFLQKYSWPIAFLFFIYALYKFYILGAEQLAHKIVGQRLIVGTAVFLVITQWLPLIYAFMIIK